ncbi:MAG: hypothetical protein ACXACO_22510 [Promethearchaeota archaeon]|jgi:hypothetical protein
MALTPSTADVSFMRHTYQNDPKHSWYQIFLLGLSFGIAWIISDTLHWDLPFEFLYYFVIAFCYIILKYIFLGIRTVFAKLRTRKNRQKRKRRSKRLVRKRFKPLITERHYAE